MKFLMINRRDNAAELKPSRARWLILTAFIAYPLAMLAALFAPKGEGMNLLVALYLALLMLTLACALPVLMSSMHRIVGEKACKLDEFEMQQRYRSLSAAYHLLTAFIALIMLYAYLGSNIGAWMPSEKEHWMAIFWGVLLYATLFPTAVLAFSSQDPVDDE